MAARSVRTSARWYRNEKAGPRGRTGHSRCGDGSDVAADPALAEVDDERDGNRPQKWVDLGDLAANDLDDDVGHERGSDADRDAERERHEDQPKEGGKAF